MKKGTWRVCALALLSASTFAACAGPAKIKPAPAAVAAPVFKKVSVPGKKAAAPADTRPLFTIGRNKNANVVHYEANLAADGTLDRKKPVTAYWVMLAGDGSRKKLNWAERMKAYGIKIRPDAAAGGYKMTLAAAPWLPLAVRQTGNVVSAEVAINGRQAVLVKMFIQARDRLLGPKVEYIELYGKDLQTGEDCREKIIPR